MPFWQEGELNNMDGFEANVASSTPMPSQMPAAEGFDVPEVVEGTALTGEFEQREVVVNVDPAEEIMQIPGDPHDKLEGLADMPDQEDKESFTYKDMVHITSEEDEALIMQGLSNAREIILANPELNPEEIFAIQEQEVTKVRMETFKAKSGEAERYKSNDEGGKWTLADAQDGEEDTSWSVKGLFEASDAGDEDVIKTGLINAKAIIMANPNLTPEQVLRIQDGEIRKARNGFEMRDKKELEMEEDEGNEQTIDQRIILAQTKVNEFMSIMTGGEGGNKDKQKELEELLKQLRKILGDIEGSKSDEKKENKMLIIALILWLLENVLGVAEKGADEASIQINSSHGY
jgi:hypothetical protein